MFNKNGCEANESSDDEDDYDAVHDSACTLITTLKQAAITTPAHQPSIILLLQAIQRLPPQTVYTHTIIENRATETADTVWTKMPHSCPILTDLYEYQRYLFHASPPCVSSTSR
jgi:hypothetical protein